MRKSTHVFAAGAVAFWALVTVSVGAQRTPGNSSPARYRGRVVDVTGSPLPGTDITCTVRGGATYRAKIDDKGEYALTSTGGACEGTDFELEGFVTERFVSPAAGVLDVILEVAFADERVWLPGAGRGFVVNADGSPAVDASVWLWRIGGAAPAGWRTNIDGAFEIPLTDYTGDSVLCARGAGERQRTACLPVTNQPFPGGKVRLKLPPRAK
jgi:hypothetical protein